MSLFNNNRITRAFAQRTRFAKIATVMATAGLLTAACDVHGPSDPGDLTTISVAPNPVIMQINGAQQFSATGTDFAGVAVTFTPTWSVVSGGGTISADGLFTAGGTPGTFTSTVSATSDGLTANATVLVTPGPLAAIAVTPSSGSVQVGATHQYVAVGRDAAGNVVQFSPTWSVVQGGGTISSTGLFTAGTMAGTYANTVQATDGTVSASATAVVTAGPMTNIAITPDPLTLNVGLSSQFAAIGTDAQGNVVEFTPAWSIVNGGGTISSTGLFTAGTTPGTYTGTVRAASGSTTASATVIVNPGVLTSIVITPSPFTLATGASRQFMAVGRDAGGNDIPVSATWAVVAGGGSIDANTGMFTAGGTSGTFSNTVRASAGGLAGFATVNVTGPLATIDVTPSPVSMGVNGTQQFVAIGRDAGGNVFLMNPTWSVVNGGGTIDSSTGLFTAGTTTGTFNATVKATSGAVSGSATVTVSPAVPTLVTIAVSPDPATMLTGGTQQFTAVGRDGDGVIIPITPVWSVENDGGSIENATGLFTAGTVAGTFNNTVKATVGGVSGTATVTVTAVPPPAPLVDLGPAAPNGIMAGTAVTCITGGTINADVSISPGNTLTGFGPCTITGTQHLADAPAAAGQLALTTAYNTLAGLPCPPANAIVADLGGTTKAAGVYCTASGIGVTGTLTLDGGGDPNATFVFQAGTTLITAGDVVLINGAQAKNVYWQVGTSATLGTASQWKGNVLTLTSITLVDNATLLGRALARNGAVSLGTNNVIILP